MVGLHKVPFVPKLPVKGILRSPEEFIPVKALFDGLPMEGGFRSSELGSRGKAMGIGPVHPTDDDMDMDMTDDIGMDMDADDEEDPGMRDYMAEGDEDELVNEVARRVAKRLQALNEKNNTIDNIAEKIMQRLTQ